MAPRRRAGGISTRGSRKLVLILLAVALPPTVTLVWLGMRLLEQDRALLAQREAERRQAALQAAIHSLQLAVSDAERSLAGGPVPVGMVRFTMSAAGVRAEPPERVAWLPRAEAPDNSDGAAFAAAERLEYQGDPGAAVAAYEALARSPQPAVRAGALLRVARVRRSQQRWTEALDAYRALSRVTDASIAGTPADLQARRSIGAVLAESGRTVESKREAEQLAADLLAGRWALDRAGWELAFADIERWTGRSVAISEERQTFSAAAEMIWTQATSGRHPHVIRVGDRATTLLWRPFDFAQDRTESATHVALAISSDVLRTWIVRAAPEASRPGRGLTLLGESGERLAGPGPPPAASVLRASAAETGLPWTLALDVVDSEGTANELTARRRLLTAGLAAILLFVAGGSYFLWRVVQRELAVARLQTEFMAAVSHEFRTPLTSLRHVTELLQEGDEVAPARRRNFYEALARNTERLHRLVESLLDFSRMESGRKPYDLRRLDAAALVADVVADFRAEVVSKGYGIELEIDPASGAAVDADAASLSNALWNLLDNAVKYSPDEQVIAVAVRPHPRGIAISVRDRGLGVPAHERKDIFGRFVRGRKAAELGIKGTGLGLAMVAHIVEAHGGSIELESEEEKGSTFTIVLPQVSGLKSQVSAATSNLRLET